MPRSGRLKINVASLATSGLASPSISCRTKLSLPTLPGKNKTLKHGGIRVNVDRERLDGGRHKRAWRRRQAPGGNHRQNSRRHDTFQDDRSDQGTGVEGIELKLWCQAK